MACLAAAETAKAIDGGMSQGRRTALVSVLLSLVCLALMVEETAAEAKGPCYECEMYNIMHSDAPQPRSGVQPHSGVQPRSDAQVSPVTCR